MKQYNNSPAFPDIFVVTPFSIPLSTIQPCQYWHTQKSRILILQHTYTSTKKNNNIYKSTTRRTARTRFQMGLQIPLYQQPERHYERRATPPQPDRTSKVCLPSYPETKANCPYLIQAFVNRKLNVFLRINISIYARSLLLLTTVVSFVSLLLIDYDYSDYRCWFSFCDHLSLIFHLSFIENVHSLVV